MVNLGNRAWFFNVALLCALGVAILLGLSFGATDGLDREMILTLRMPRVLLAIVVGAGLSLAGVALQALFANPLCEPYTFGVSSGAALGSAIGAALGWGALSVAGVALPSFLGALSFTALLLIWAARIRASGYQLLMAGVLLSFLGSSGVAVWMALSDPSGIQGALFWLLGDLSRAEMGSVILAGTGVLTVAGILYGRHRKLDALLLGEERARALGVSVASERRLLLSWVSVLIGFCVSVSGMIGFIGLAVPHAVRLMRGSLHREVIPGSMLLGAVVLVISDLLARVAARPIELPVGVVTALWGAPVLLWILSKRGGGLR